MIHAIEDINVIPFKRVLKKNDHYGKIRFFSIGNEIKNLAEKNDLPAQQPELPFSEWTTPAEPQGYIKGRDNDLL